MTTERYTAQEFSPDTCRCVLGQWIDNEELEGSRESYFSRLFHVCEVHQKPDWGKHNHPSSDDCTGRYVWQIAHPETLVLIGKQVEAKEKEANGLMTLLLTKGYRASLFEQWQAVNDDISAFQSYAFAVGHNGKVVQGGDCPAGERLYHQVYENENRLKNRIAAWAALLVPWQHVFHEVYADASLAEKIGPRLIRAEASELAAVDLLQKIEYLSPIARFEQLAKKLSEKMLVAAYGWSFDEDRVLNASFDITLRPEHRAAIEKEIIRIYGPGVANWRFADGEKTAPQVMPIAEWEKEHPKQREEGRQMKPVLDELAKIHRW